MEHIVNPHIEKLPEDVYLATSDDVQGRTIQETLEIARDLAKKLTEAQHGQPVLPQPSEAFDYFGRGG